jgi:hypothetical protein
VVGGVAAGGVVCVFVADGQTERVACQAIPQRVDGFVVGDGDDETRRPEEADRCACGFALHQTGDVAVVVFFSTGRVSCKSRASRMPGCDGIGVMGEWSDQTNAIKRTWYSKDTLRGECV